MQSVIKDKRAIGFILPSARGWKAFYGDTGVPLGYFGSANAAAKSIYEAAAKPGASND